MATEGERASRRDVLDRLGVAVPGFTDDPELATTRVSQQLLVVTRVLLTPVFVVGGLLADDVHPLFWLVLALRVVWQAAGVAATSHPRHWRRYPVRLTPVVDLTLTTASLLTTGGGDSPLRIVLIGLPAAGGYLATPAIVAIAGTGVVVSYLLAAAPDLLRGVDGAGGRLADFLLLAATSTAAASAFAWGRVELTRRTGVVHAARRKLLTSGLTAEDRERRRVSQELHGEALQVLLAASQDLAEDDPGALGRARDGVRDGGAALRETVRDLHPAALRHLPLEQAVRAALDHRVRDVLEVTVEPDVQGERDDLLLSIVRDLGDALTSAGVDTAVVARVSCEAQAVVLAVSAAARLDQLGRMAEALAHVSERLEADGGSVTVGVGLDGRAALELRLCRESRTRLDRRADTADADEVKRQAQLLHAVLWLGVTLVTALLAELSGAPDALSTLLLVLIGAYYATVAAASLTSRWDRVWSSVGTATTLLAYGVVIGAQGGIQTAAPALTLLLPFMLVLVARPVGVALGSLLLGLTVAAACAGPVLDRAPGELTAALVGLATYTWAALSAVLIAVGRERMRRRLTALAHARRRLLHDSLAVADQVRHQISLRLHDGALQDVLIAGQDLDSAIDGDPEGLGFARVALASGVEQLREAVAELHPPALEHGGLRPAVAAVVERVCARGGLRGTVEVDPAADGARDELVVALVRELVTNVGKHAAAEEMEVRVLLRGGWLVVSVADDGVGTTQDRLTTALAHGHIGLASARERVEADGGRLDVETAPGAGTRVRVRLRAAGDAEPEVAAEPVRPGPR